MRKAALAAILLAAVVLSSGCTAQQGDLPGNGDSQDSGGDLEASAYDELEKELEQAIEDIDLGDLENEITNV